MKEQGVPTPELTVSKPYSTLDVGSVMDSKPPEKPAEVNRSSTATNKDRLREGMVGKREGQAFWGEKLGDLAERAGVKQPADTPESLYETADLGRFLRDRMNANMDQGEAQSNRILEELGFPPEIIRQAADLQQNREAERLSTSFDHQNVLQDDEAPIVIDSSGITNPKIKAILDKINPFLEDGGSIETVLRELPKEMSNMFGLRNEGIDPKDIKEGMKILQQTYKKLVERIPQERGFRGFSLQDNDMDMIRREGAEAWLDGQFDILYEISKKTQILDSPQVRNIEAKFNEAVGFMLLEGKKEEEVVKVQNSYNIRTSLIFARASVDRRNLEGIQGSVARLQTTGLFTALSLDGGRVGAVFNRMVDMANAVRVREGGFETDSHGNHILSERQHMSNKMMNDLRPELIDEQFKMATLRGVGVFADRLGVIREAEMKKYQKNPAAYEPGDPEKEARRLLEREIRRAVNAAYDVYGVTQQQAVEASRGKRIEKMPYKFFSDPKSIFDSFNIEEFLTNKWGTLNHPQLLFLRQIKLDLARHEAKGVDVARLTVAQQEELGKRLFKEFFTAPDFFSSGWRMRGMRDQITRLQTYYIYNQKLAGNIADNGYRMLLQQGPVIDSESRRENELLASLTTKIQFIREEAARDIPAGVSDAEKRQTVQKRIEHLLRDTTNPDNAEMFITREERSLYIAKMGFTEEMKKAIGKEAEENAGNLALFMQLKAEGTGPEKVERSTAIWKKIQKYRPEEIIRFVRERQGFKGGREGFAQLDELDKIFENNGIPTEHTTTLTGESVVVRAHDVFRRDYLPVLSFIRQQALTGMPPKPVDFRNLTAEQVRTINQSFRPEKDASGNEINHAERIQNIFNSMDNYIENHRIDGKNTIEQFTTSSEYEDLYARTQRSDDVILDQLEVIPENMERESGTVSEHWNAESQADALVRNYNDLSANQKAGGALVGFLTTEGKEEYRKKALEFAAHVKDYNGWGGAASAFRYTFGSYLLVAEQDYLVDLLNVGKLGRIASSDIERIFGPGVSPLTREQLLKELDHVRGFLETDEADSEKYYRQLMEQLGIDNFSRFRDKAFTGVIYLMLLVMLGAALGSGVKAFAEVNK